MGTLSKQIYEFDLKRSDQWKGAIGYVWNIKDEKNSFVDKKQLEKRENLCIKGCKRLNNKDTNPNSGKTYSTCCSSCAQNYGEKDFVHESYCEKRHYSEWRKQIRNEALKKYLLKHPLQKISEQTEQTEQNQPSESDKQEKEDEMHSVRYSVSLPEKNEMIKYIKEELSFHKTTKIVLSMKSQLINVKTLRDELKNKTHGDIVSILIKLERMFKFKIMCSLNKGNISKLDFSKFKPTKAMPEWWADEWDHCMVEGTLKYGWGNVPSQFARENYQFTPTYKGKKKEKKVKKKSPLKDLQNGMEKVKLNGTAPTTTTAPTPPSPPILIVKKRQWVPEGKKQESILISICNHFRKEIREKFKKVTTKIKNANKLREQQVFNPSLNNITSLTQEMAKMNGKTKKNKKKKKVKKDKNAFDTSEFGRMNDITNYFPNGAKNAFALLGKKQKSPKKKKKSKYNKTKLAISFDDNGNFKMPIKIGKTKMIKNLGEICTEKGYHATSYIYPIGYKCCISQLPSFKRPGQNTTFTTIIAKGDNGPLFIVSCSDDPEFKISAKNPSSVWGQLKQKWLDLEIKEKDSKSPSTTPKKTEPINQSPPTKSKSSGHGISGPQKIGLAHQDIKRVIECLPNALKCTNYKFKFRTDSDHTLTSKKAFKKTLKISKKDKKDKKKEKKDKESRKIIDNNGVHTISSMNMNNNNNNNNVIVIEDSPSNNGVIPTLTASNTNITNINNIIINNNNMMININSNSSMNNSLNGSEVIDLCDDSDNDENDNNNNDKKKKMNKTVTKKNRKRKHPDNDNNNNEQNEIMLNDNDQCPKKKRRIDYKNNNGQQQKLSTLWAKEQK